MPETVKGALRHLWILRHGKAASDAPWGGGDRERPLTARGRRDASALGKRLAEESPVLGLNGVRRPDVAICSAAVRTRQTARLIVKALSNRLPLESYRSLYGADTGLVLQSLREIDDGVEGALLVGHNPTMFELVWELLVDADGDPPGSDRARLESHGFPTCALAVLALPIDSWKDVAPDSASLEGLFKPPY